MFVYEKKAGWKEISCYIPDGTILKVTTGNTLNPLAENFRRYPKEAKGPETVTSHDWPSFHMTQCDWPKGNHLAKGSLACE